LPEGLEPEDCLITWGARAIWPGFTDEIDLLPDRQGMEMPGRDDLDSELSAELREWGSGSVWGDLRTWCMGISQRDYDVFLSEQGPFGLRATPNGSYGYLYIRAWKLKPEAQERREAALSGKEEEADVSVSA